jgi:hypothetical protein
MEYTITHCLQWEQLVISILLSNAVVAESNYLYMFILELGLLFIYLFIYF